jgi:hypothetical protein
VDTWDLIPPLSKPGLLLSYVVSWIRLVQPRRVGDAHVVVLARVLVAALSRWLLRPRGRANAPTLLFFSVDSELK